jgi:hypothetical protein
MSIDQFHKIVKQGAFIHVDPENIVMGCPMIKFEFALGWGIPWLYSQGPHERTHTLLNIVMFVIATKLNMTETRFRSLAIL